MTWAIHRTTPSTVHRCASAWGLWLMALSACGGGMATPDAAMEDADVTDTGAADGASGTSGSGGMAGNAGTGGTAGMAGSSGTGGTGGSSGSGGIVIPPWEPPPPPTRLTPSCEGSAWSCDLNLGSISCNQAPGCSWVEDCTGVSRSCYSLYSSYFLHATGRLLLEHIQQQLLRQLVELQLHE